MREKSKRYMVKLKNDETKYSKYLEKRHIYYKDVLKPKKQKVKEDAHEALPTTLVI